MADTRRFLLNTEYPVDKIVYLKEGSFIASGASNGPESASFHSFQHGLPFTPLLDGNWSFDADFTRTFELFHPLAGFLPGRQFMRCYADATKVEFDFRNWSMTNRPDFRVYYRVYGFMPPDVSMETATDPTSSQSSNKFIFNTEQNYSKLFITGSIVIGSDGRGVINHNLGYLPQVDLWEVSDGQIYKMSVGYGVRVTESQLIFEPPSSGFFGPMTGKFYYRIYADGF